MYTFLLWLLLWAPKPTPVTKLIVGNDTSLMLRESTSVDERQGPAALKTSPRSGSSNAGSGQTAGKGSTEELNVWAMLLIIVSCGLLGGIWNYLRTYDTVKAETPDGTDPVLRLRHHWQTCLLGGIIAGGIVPFLLISTSSKLLEDPSTYHYFVFGAYCLAAAVSSAAFIEAAASSLVKRLQADLKQTKQALATTTAQTIQLQGKADKLESIAMTLHGIQQLANPAGAVNPAQQQQFDQQMQVLSDQLDAVKN